MDRTVVYKCIFCPFVCTLLRTSLEKLRKAIISLSIYKTWIHIRRRRLYVVFPLQTSLQHRFTYVSVVIVFIVFTIQKKGYTNKKALWVMMPLWVHYKSPPEMTMYQQVFILDHFCIQHSTNIKQYIVQYTSILFCYRKNTWVKHCPKSNPNFRDIT